MLFLLYLNLGLFFQKSLTLDQFKLDNPQPSYLLYYLVLSHQKYSTTELLVLIFLSKIMSIDQHQSFKRNYFF